MAADEGRGPSRNLTRLVGAMHTPSFWPDCPKVWHEASLPRDGLLFSVLLLAPDGENISFLVFVSKDTGQSQPGANNRVFGAISR